MREAEFARNYLTDLQTLLPQLDTERIGAAVQLLAEARDQGRMIAICGNGGSSSIAAQMVVDMVKCSSYEREKRFRMICLSDSIATLTAYANDVSYDDVFAEPLKNFCGPGDVLIAISGSGNSENVLRAVRHAVANGIHTIGVTTGEGGQLRELAAISLTAPSRHMGRLEDCFFVMTHILCYAFIEAGF